MGPFVEAASRGQQCFAELLRCQKELSGSLEAGPGDDPKRGDRPRILLVEYGGSF